MDSGKKRVGGQYDQHGNSARAEVDGEVNGSIRTIGIEQDGPLELSSLMRWLTSLLLEYGGNLYRMKALCCVADASFPLELDSIRQAVGPLACSDTHSWKTHRSNLILAGEGLEQEGNCGRSRLLPG